VSRTPAPDRQLHLLEVGLSWPPETFIRWKLEVLAHRGFRVGVASADVYDPEFALPGVELHRIPPWGVPVWKAAICVAWDCLKVGIRSPRRLVRLLRAVGRRALRSPARRELSLREQPRRALHEDLLRLRLLAPLASLRPDVVHFEWESTAVRFLPLVEVFDCPLVTSCHGGMEIYARSPEYAGMIDSLPEVFRRAAAVQCVSEVERRAAVEHGLDPDKAVVLPCGVDPGRFSPPAARNGTTFRVLSVGWLRWVKGYEYAVQTLRLLLDRGIEARLDVYGGDPLPAVKEASEAGRIRLAIDDLGVGEHVFLHGYVPTEELVERYRGAHALLHSGVSEGLPVVVLEAMASGLPVVAGDCGGVADAVRNGVDGFVVPVRDPEAAAAALERVWREPGLGERMGRAGRDRVQSEFSLQRQVSRLEKIYREAVASPGTARR
jgi:glycosyltransferase involved in cell wall biosynthesis